MCVLHVWRAMTSKIDIRTLRNRVGWSRGQLASYLGIDPSHVSRLESGRRITGPARRLLALLHVADGEGRVSDLERDIARGEQEMGL